MPSNANPSRTITSKPARVGLLIFVALTSAYLLAYGPVWSLASRGVIRWETLQALYRPVPIRMQRLLHDLWKPSGLFGESSAESTSAAAPSTPSPPQE